MKSVLILLALPPLLAGYVLAIALALDTSQTLPQYLLLLPLVYVLGSVPWGFLIIRLSQGVDIREYGSGRIGTSNVLRTAGLRTAAAVFILDLSKGALAVVLAKIVVGSATAEVVAGLLALAGHNWSMFLNFKGGRGIVPCTGAMVIFAPIVTAVSLAVFVLTAYSTRYVSLASLLGVSMAVIATVVQVAITDFAPVYLIYFGVSGFIIFWQHRDNILRLLRGTERRLGDSANKLAENG